MPKLYCEKEITFEGRPAIQRNYFIGDLDLIYLSNDFVPDETKTVQEIVFKDGEKEQKITGSSSEFVGVREQSFNTFNQVYSLKERIDLKRTFGLETPEKSVSEKAKK